MNPRLHLIIKNTFFLYVRLLFIMIISLYISRILLKMLGVDDFGIYSIVGSITGMFLSIRSIFAEATQRYLNNAKGFGDNALVQKIFSTSLFLHLFVGIVFVVVVLIVGEILIDTTLKIPVERISSARMAFYFSVLSIFIIIMTIPFDAVIMANEKINVYAIVSIIDSILKLIIVVITPLFGLDNLIIYTLLLCCVSLFTLIVYYFYTRQFPECKILWIFERKLIKDLGSFSMWNFIGNFIFSIVHEVYNMLLNLYGGVVSNAARNIAYQIRAAVSQFSNNALVAVKPFVMQETATKDSEKIFDYINRISSFTYYMSLIMSVPIIIFASEILKIWLDSVPEGASIFTQLVVFALLIRSLHGPLSLMFVSYAKIRVATIVEGGLYLLSILVVYMMLSRGMPLWTMFFFLCIIEVFCIISLTFIGKYELGFNVSTYFSLLARLAFLTILIFAVSFLIRKLMLFESGDVMGLIALVILSLVSELLVIYMLMRDSEKSVVHNIVKSIVKK